jgi:hypothetical protein
MSEFALGAQGSPERSKGVRTGDDEFAAYSICS